MLREAEEELELSVQTISTRAELFRPASEWLAERSRPKTQRIPTASCFFVWQDLGTVGQDPEGNLVFQDTDGLYTVIHKDLKKKAVQTLLADLVECLGYRYDTLSAEAFWHDFLTAPRQSLLAEDQLEINTLHKQKGVKVEPVNDAGQAPRTINGRLD